MGLLKNYIEEFKAVHELDQVLTQNIRNPSTNGTMHIASISDNDLFFITKLSVRASADAPAVTTSKKLRWCDFRERIKYDMDIPKLSSNITKISNDIGTFRTETSINFQKVDSNINYLSGKIDTISSNLNNLSGKFNTVSSNLNGLSGKFNTVSSNLNGLSGKFNTVSSDFYELSRITLPLSVGVLNSNVNNLNNSACLSINTLNQNIERKITPAIPAIDADDTALAGAKATAEFVNSSIATNTANFKGTFTSEDDFPAEATNNDYLFFDTTDEEGNRIFKRYKYVEEKDEWQYEYVLNNSSFTSAQWNVISGGPYAEAGDFNALTVLVDEINNKLNEISDTITFSGEYEDGTIFSFDVYIKADS